MMSSFRPNVETPELAFSPLVFGQTAEDGFSATSPEIDRDQRTDPSAEDSASSSGGDPEPTEAPLHTAEEVAEREAAAFARGAESAAVGTAAVEAAFGALEAAAEAVQVAAATDPLRNRQQVVELAALIASRWVQAELRQDPARYVELLERAFEAGADESQRKLFLNAEDLALLESDFAQRLAEWKSNAGIDLVSDPDLERCAFRIETPHTSIDGRPDPVRDRLEEALAEMLGEPGSEAAE